MEPPPYRRRRPALSCIECRRRKIKCDRNSPCAHCVAAKTSCTYKKVYRAEFQKAQRANSPCPISSPLAAASSCDRSVDIGGRSKEHSHQEHSFEHGAVVENSICGVRGDSHSEPPETLRAAQHGGLDVEPPLPSLQKFETFVSREQSQLSKSASSDAGPNILAIQAKVHDAQISLDKDRVIKWRQWTGMNSEVRLVWSLKGINGSLTTP